MEGGEPGEQCRKVELWSKEKRVGSVKQKRRRGGRRRSGEQGGLEEVEDCRKRRIGERSGL